MTNNLLQQDQAARARALSPTESFIVQAPAGSGKTELLIQRILTLLAHVRKPEEILAITFTKKSAHEMRARILKALDYAATQSEPEKAHEKLTYRLASAVLKRDKELKWNLQNNPNQLHIKTIDSFCSYLTGQLPLLSHFGAQPDISIYAVSLYREAVLEVLSHIEASMPWSQSVAALLKITDNDLDKLANLLIKMLSKRDQWLKTIFNTQLADSLENMRAILSENIASVVESELTQLAEAFPDAYTDELLALMRYAADHAERMEEAAEMRIFRDITTLPKDSANAINLWQGIASFLLTDDGNWRKKPMPSIGFPTLKSTPKAEQDHLRQMNERHKNLCESFGEMEQLRTLLSAIRKLPQPTYTDLQWDTLQALLEVLKVTLAQLRVTFQLHGQIDFIENAEAASVALGDASSPTDLALALDYQIKHILIDEFQDTSFPQLHLLEKLTYGWQPDDGRTLFVVGDPMQSIYRFRQAEVGNFIRMQEFGIGDLQLTNLTLSVNFRSAPSIVSWNNQQCAAIFPVENKIETGAVKFTPSIANSASDTEQNVITIDAFKDASDLQQAHAAIRYIRDTLQQYPNEKIAILVRSRTHLAALIPALKVAGLPYSAVEIDPLVKRQYIQDCLSLTRALMHPCDRIAWLSLLRAPWCGLNLKDLLALCMNHKHEPLWEVLTQKDALVHLSADGKTRIERIMPVLHAALQNRERSSFREWIEHTWLALGGPAGLTDETEMADIQAYFDLLDQLSSQGQRIHVETLMERIAEFRATSHQEAAPIQIMTIHSAKGLEFDTVILPHLEKSGARDDSDILLWMNYQLHHAKETLLMAPLHTAGSEPGQLYQYIQSLQKDKSALELDRLFYVAVTRAKKRLHLVFSVDENEKAASGSFLKKLWPLIQNQSSYCNDTAITDSIESSSKPRPITRLISNWHNPVSIKPHDESSSQQSRNGFILPDVRAKITGTVTHFIFQQISNLGLAWWQQQSAQQPYIRRQLISAGYPIMDIDAGVTLIQTMITRTLEDERGKWILSPHEYAQSEYQLTTVTEDGYENIVIDRTFIENDIRWIIDYKTAEIQDDDITVFLEKQKQKHAAQISKYIRALQSRESRTIKAGLYFPALASWCDYQD